MMTAPENPPDFLAAALRDCLDTLAAGGPDLPELAATISRLKELAAAAHPGGGYQPALPATPLTLPQALQLTTTARSLLATGAALDSPAAVLAETATALAGLLPELAGQLGAALRREKAAAIRGLYVIIDPEVTGGREPLTIAQAALRGGAKILQLRDKRRDKGEILPLARALQDLCQANDALLILNDHADLAAAVGSGGVHIGQTDLPVAQARQVLAPEQVIGRSNREIALLIESQEMGADHVAFGAIYPTTTKPGGRGPQGPERLRESRAVTQVPLVAIGGITAANVAPVIAAGADAVCVTAAVGLAPEPEAAAAGLVEAIRQAGGKV